MIEEKKSMEKFQLNKQFFLSISEMFISGNFEVTQI